MDNLEDKINVFDLGGQDRFEFLIGDYIKSFKPTIIIYTISVNDLESCWKYITNVKKIVENVYNEIKDSEDKKYEKELKKGIEKKYVVDIYTPLPREIYAITKMDLIDETRKSELEKFIKDKNIKFGVLTSSIENTGIEILDNSLSLAAFGEECSKEYNYNKPRLSIFGKGGSGKSQLLNKLKKEEFNPDISMTIFDYTIISAKKNITI
jgi:GTPase SAR1 family protein